MSRSVVAVKRVSAELERPFTELWIASRVEDGASPELVARAASEGRVSTTLARDDVRAFVALAEGGDPAEIAEREGLTAMEDSGELEAIVAKVIADNPDVVERIKGGNAKAMGALVGPVMRETKGRADGGEVNRLLKSALGL